MKRLVEQFPITSCIEICEKAAEAGTLELFLNMLLGTIIFGVCFLHPLRKKVILVFSLSFTFKGKNFVMVPELDEALYSELRLIGA